MTTIAYKDGVIAYDSRATRGDVIMSDDCEKCETHDGVKFLLAGAVSDIKAFVAAYFGTRSEIPLDCFGYVIDGGRLMLVGNDDDTGIWRQDLNPNVCDAIGSGSPYALAAMDMGASAEDAVRAAMKRDVYTGGTVRTFKIGEK